MTSAPVGPEALAHVVLRCRELALFLESVAPTLPRRAETPFLHGQLDDVLRRLQAGLKSLGLDQPAKEERGGFLRSLVSKKPRVVQTTSEARYDLQGNAWTIPVTELVNFLSHSGKTGLLWVTSSVETFVLEFAQGNLVHATSNAPPVAFRLGEILLNAKLLEPAELAAVIEHAKAADDLLGSFLVRSGRLEQSELQRALAIQVQELFHRLMDAENAIYRFQEGAQLLRSQGLEVNITQLLLESARKKDEARQRHDAREAQRQSELETRIDGDAVAPSLPTSERDASARATSTDPLRCLVEGPARSEPAPALPVSAESGTVAGSDEGAASPPSAA